jgi:hypothetical protein
MKSEDLCRHITDFADPALKPLLLEVLAAYTAPSFNAGRARLALVELFHSLCTPELRTDRNCQFVDFCLGNVAALKESAGALSQYRDFLSNANVLHDTIGAPSIAENFGCLPEQLLAEARTL